MEQLSMSWKNDGTEAIMPDVPDGLELHKITDFPNGIDMWLDVVQYGLSEKKEDEAFYNCVMVGHENYDASYCYLLTENGISVATVTVIFYLYRKHGYIHMVACKNGFRGRGIGTFLSEFAVYLLKKKGMLTADLTTDDWRIPAIKTYLKVGFTPDITSGEMSERWENVLNIIKK